LTPRLLTFSIGGINSTITLASQNNLQLQLLTRKKSNDVAIANCVINSCSVEVAISSVSKIPIFLEGEVQFNWKRSYFTVNGESFTC
jgi:hypothetical protein